MSSVLNRKEIIHLIIYVIFMILFILFEHQLFNFHISKFYGIIGYVFFIVFMLVDFIYLTKKLKGVDMRILDILLLMRSLFRVIFKVYL